MTSPKEFSKVRYAYGVAAALLIGGSAFSLTTGTAGAQVAQNAPSAMPPRAGAPMSFADLAARLQPAVVNISTRQRVPVRAQSDPMEEFFRRFGAPVPQQDQGGQAPRTRETGSLGSGFIISPDGYIVTNNHLIQGAGGTGTVDQVTVTLPDRREFEARIVGRDVPSDLALLKINGNNLPFVNWGDSTRSRVGEWVLAIGNPYGLGGSVTSGIISALHRGITGVGAYDRYIQTDASINMGNSGGPMFDLNGNVIGVNSALISPTGANVGIGLAIPAELAWPVIESLRRGQAPQRGYLGVGLQPIDDDDLSNSLGIPKGRGELVRSVVPSGSAARAGIQQGDVILTVNGRAVTDENTVSYLIANTPVGSRVPVEVVGADGRRRTVQVSVAQRPSEEELARQAGGDQGAFPENDNNPAPAVPANQSLGLTLQALTPEIARATNLPANARGVIIARVDPNSDAAEKGLRRGDLILSVNRQAVTQPSQVAAAISSAKAARRTSVLLLVKRGTAPEQFIAVDIAPR